MDVQDLGEHTLHTYNDELEALRGLVTRMGGLVEDQLERALDAYCDHDAEAAAAVVEGDREINAMELEIDELIATIIARRQPMAGDLRFVLAVSKATTDLERMGDEAVRVARMAMQCEELPGQLGPGVRRIGRTVRGMLRDALDAFARTELEVAGGLARRDREVDADYESLTREIVTHIMDDPRVTPRGLAALLAGRALERIGDRACNVAEYVVYYSEGRDVRHGGLSQGPNREGLERDGPEREGPGNAR